jgi:sugar phosphate isomerase/epimerase
MGYRAVQLSALGPIETAELKKILDGEGLTVCATHEEYEMLRDQPQAMIDKHKSLRCKYVAIGGMPKEYRSAEGFARFAREASDVAARLADGGLTFCYHNHNFEFEKFGDRTGFQILYTESDPTYFKGEPDTYWIQAGGGDPAHWIQWLAKRAPLIHLKDMTMQGWEQKFAEVGEGNLNWPAILKACRTAGAVWYIVEQDICKRDPFESLAISLRNLQSWQAAGAPGIRA